MENIPHISQLLFKLISLFFLIKFTTFILKKYLTNDFGFLENANGCPKDIC